MFVYLIRDIDNFYKVGGAMLDISTNKNNSDKYVYSTRDFGTVVTSEVALLF